MIVPKSKNSMYKVNSQLNAFRFTRKQKRKRGDEFWVKFDLIPYSPISVSKPSIFFAYHRDPKTLRGKVD